MTAYYNEFKPETAHMLRQLIRDGLIAAGDVDERPIQEVKADDLKGYTQCHFFAGIGGWSVALRLAGWSDTRPVWTGSCPCQPFSTAGNRKGKADERHLWPVWFRLIAECQPAIIFGEQVAAAIAHGWWDDVANDLESEGYACGSAVLPACSVGKPHKRDRLWFVGNTELYGLSSKTFTRKPRSNAPEGKEGTDFTEQFEGTSPPRNVPEHVADTDSARLQGHRGYEQQHGAEGWQEQDGYTGEADLQWLICPDGKSRPIISGVPLLAHGIQHRTPILHAFGNAIVPQVAAEFIKATEGA